MRQSYRMLRYTALATAVLGGSSVLMAGNVITINYDSPDLDKWMYPFNPTPGLRPAASLFGAFGNECFDNRDGQMIIGFDTDADIPTDLGSDSYNITSATVTLMFDGQGDSLFYDNTQDPFGVYLAFDDPFFEKDVDPGHAIELFGLGYRNEFTIFNFEETTAFDLTGTECPGPGARNAYALGFNAGETVDVSNSVREEYDPKPFAVGQIDDRSPGDLVQAGDEYVFDIDIEDEDFQSYLQDGLDVGILRFAVTSHHIVEFMGGSFPTLFCKENGLVIAGVASAAQLDLTVELVDDAGPTPDLNGDDVVGPGDLAILLGTWGPCPVKGECPADLNEDGSVGPGDLAILLGTWGPIG